MRRIDTVVIHHSASPRDDTSVEEITEWHLARRFSEIGYHYIITGDGVLYYGRPLHKMGAHCKGSNLHSIGVCVTGNFEDEIPSDAQTQRLDQLLSALSMTFGVITVVGHCDLGNTLCPGKTLYDLL